MVLCKMLSCVVVLPTLLSIVLLVYVVYHAKQQVMTLAENAVPNPLILPSLSEIYGTSTHSLMEARFNAWANSYNKKYHCDKERQKRLALFVQTVKTVEEHNAKVSAGSDMFRMGLNEYSDMSDEEFMEHFNLGKIQGQEDCSATTKKSLKAVSKERPSDMPLSKDWRKEGIVSPVKNQGHCGSCWTFSSTGALEAHYKKKTGRLVSLSEQQLLDCAGNYDNHGCNGGLPSHAFQYIMENGGLDLERAYPYEMKSEGTTCRFKKFGVGTTVKGVFNITQFDEAELELAVAFEGPVSIAFQVAGDFRSYASGVYESSQCKNQPKDVNHAVLAVGFGVAESGTKYWIVKNSWGAGWGDHGYFLIKRGVNMCGVADCASYPIL